MEHPGASIRTGLAAVNTTFIEERLASRWLSFDHAGKWVYPAERLRRVARSRGLNVVREPGASLFFEGERCVGGLVGMRPSLSSGISATICGSKSLTKQLLLRAGLPTPDFRLFDTEELELAREYLVSRCGEPLVLKPQDGNQGKGITTGLRTPSELDPAWARARIATKTGGLLLEEEVPGVDVRVTVVAGRAIAVAARVPPFVVGDGASTLEQLIAELTEARGRHAYMNKLKLIPDPDYLERQGVQADTVMPKDKVQLLNGTANLSRGGVPVDITETTPDKILRMSEAVVDAIPGLGYAGVDVLMPNTDSADGAAVIEVDASPNPLVHDLPVFGSERHICEAIVDEIIRRSNY